MRVLYYAETTMRQSSGVANVGFYLPAALTKRLSITYFPLLAFKGSYAKNLLDVYARFVRKDFDILHFNYVPVRANGSYMLLEFGRKMGYPIVLNIHGIGLLENKLDMVRKPSFLPLITALRSCKVADVIVANSKYMKTKLETIYRVDPNKVVVIPNGIDLSIFKEQNNRLTLQGDPSILFLGSLRRVKGVDILLKAIAKLKTRLPSMRVHLVGPGQKSTYQAMAKALDIEKLVVFHGSVSHKNVPLYFKSANICVFPSRHEGFPLVVLEAMASGVPILASKIEIFQEVLNEGERGLLFESENPIALSNSIFTLCQDLDLRKRISKAALDAVQNYSWDIIAEKYLSLYRNLLS